MLLSPAGETAMIATPGRARTYFDAADVHSGGLQIIPRLFSEYICTDFSDQLHWITKAAHGDSLVSPFPSRVNSKAAAKYRFASTRKLCRARDQVSIDAAHHHDRFMIG